MVILVYGDLIPARRALGKTQPKALHFRLPLDHWTWLYFLTYIDDDDDEEKERG